VPFVSIVLAALQPQDTPISGLNIPDQLTWSNFAETTSQGPLNRLVLSSAIIAPIGGPQTLLLAALAGSPLALVRPPGARAISLAFVLGLTLPVELVVVALYFNLRPLGLTTSYLGVALAESALFLPFAVYWMQTHFTGIPRELVESGRIDGANDRNILAQVL